MKFTFLNELVNHDGFGVILVINQKLLYIFIAYLLKICSKYTFTRFMCCTYFTFATAGARFVNFTKRSRYSYITARVFTLFHSWLSNILKFNLKRNSAYIYCWKTIKRVVNSAILSQRKKCIKSRSSEHKRKKPFWQKVDRDL